MMNIEFTDQIPNEPVVWATISQNSAVPQPFAYQQSVKPQEAVLEAFTEEMRHLFLQLGTTCESREQEGAALYKRAITGIEKSIVLDVRKASVDALDLLSGMLLASWRFDKYRTSFKPDEMRYLEKIIVLSSNPKELEATFSRQKAAIEGVLLARELTSEPSNCLYPMAYAEKLLELEQYGIEVEILDKEAMQAIGMTALLAAGQGSQHPPCVVCLTWKGSGSHEKPTLLVGKGVCFDSGGVCLKPPKQQLVMKWDKAGAGAVVGAMKALALGKCPTHVVGIVGLIENMPDGKAIKPGDVVKTMSGQTIEIVDTDAEGRLVLADCLWYGQKRYKPERIVDLGTLTQETFASLGSKYAALYCNNKKLTEELLSAGITSGDELWRLPMGKYFAKQIESSVADIKNLGTEYWGENGAAAEFLQRFVTTPNWAHIDIAGVSWTDEDSPLCTKGPTGYGVRLLEKWIYA